MPPRSAFLEALGQLESAAPPGSPISVEAVATSAGLARGDAIRTGLELIEEGRIRGVLNRGDDEVKSINGLTLSGLGRRDLLRQRSLRFMLSLEENAGGDPDAACSAGEIGAEFGWSAREAANLASTLEDDGLIESIETGSDLVTITSAGRRQLDHALANDDSPSQMLAPLVYIAGDVVGSQVQAGTVGSAQHQTISLTSQMAEIRAFAVELRRVLPQLTLDDDERAVVGADLAAVEAQLASPRPNEGVLREGLRSLRAVAEGVVGSAAFAGLAELASHIHL